MRRGVLALLIITFLLAGVCYFVSLDIGRFAPQLADEYGDLGLAVVRAGAFIAAAYLLIVMLTLVTLQSISILRKRKADKD